MEIKKRFIAGAVCPRCAEMDRIVMYTHEGRQYRECVACGFKDQMGVSSPPKELETRVNKTAEEKQNDIQPVKIIFPD